MHQLRAVKIGESLRLSRETWEKYLSHLEKPAREAEIHAELAEPSTHGEGAPAVDVVPLAAAPTERSQQRAQEWDERSARHHAMLAKVIKRAKRRHAAKGLPP
jgi:hypothetical protein